MRIIKTGTQDSLNIPMIQLHPLQSPLPSSPQKLIRLPVVQLQSTLLPMRDSELRAEYQFLGICLEIKEKVAMFGHQKFLTPPTNRQIVVSFRHKEDIRDITFETARETVYRLLVTRLEGVEERTSIPIIPDELQCP